MTSLPVFTIEQFSEDIRRELRADKFGRIHISRKGAARLLNVSASTIGRRVALSDSKTAETTDAIIVGGVALLSSLSDFGVFGDRSSEYLAIAEVR